MHAAEPVERERRSYLMVPVGKAGCLLSLSTAPALKNEEGLDSRDGTAE